MLRYYLTDDRGVDGKCGGHISPTKPVIVEHGADPGSDGFTLTAPRRAVNRTTTGDLACAHGYPMTIGVLQCPYCELEADQADAVIADA